MQSFKFHWRRICWRLGNQHKNMNKNAQGYHHPRCTHITIRIHESVMIISITPSTQHHTINNIISENSQVTPPRVLRTIYHCNNLPILTLFAPATVALGTWWWLTVSARPKLPPSRPAAPDEAPGASGRERGGKMIYILRLWNYQRWWNPITY